MGNLSLSLYRFGLPCLALLLFFSYTFTLELLWTDLFILFFHGVPVCQSALHSTHAIDHYIGHIYHFNATVRTLLDILGLHQWPLDINI